MHAFPLGHITSPMMAKYVFYMALPIICIFSSLKMHWESMYLLARTCKISNANSQGLCWMTVVMSAEAADTSINIKMKAAQRSVLGIGVAILSKICVFMMLCKSIIATMYAFEANKGWSWLPYSLHGVLPTAMCELVLSLFTHLELWSVSHKTQPLVDFSTVSTLPSPEENGSTNSAVSVAWSIDTISSIKWARWELKILKQSSIATY